MGQADIAYMIKRIYDKYNATQEDKKYEERVYMREDEFRYNLEEMVKKSPIDDKALLYKEIYRNISENALEIDSNGTISISPKLIIEVEKEIEAQNRVEQNLENDTQSIEEENMPQIISMNDYDNMSEEEKDELFEKSLGWIFESPEEAKKARQDMEALSVDTSVDATEILKKKNKGEKIPEEDLRTTFGTEIIPESEKMQLQMLKWSALLQTVTNSGKYKVFFKGNDGNREINTPLLEFLGARIKDPNVRFEDIEKMITDSLEKLAQKDPSVKKPGKEDLEEIRRLFDEDRDKFDTLIKGLRSLGATQKFYKDNLIPDLHKYFEHIMTGEEVSNTFDGFMVGVASLFGVKEDMQKNIPTFFGFSKDNPIFAMDKWGNTMQGIKVRLNERSIEYNEYMTRSEDETRIENLASSFWDINVPQGHLGDITRNGHVIDPSEYGRTDEIYGIKDIGRNSSIMTPDQISEAAKKFREINVGQIPGVKSKPVVEQPTKVEDFIIKPVVEFEEEFDAAIMAIGDSGDDAFAAMFGDMAEEMTVGGAETEITPDLETEAELDSEEEKVSDIPFVNNGAGVVVEDMAVGDTSQEHTQTETVEPEQTAMVVDTAANRIKRSLIEFGKNVGKAVKGIFGKIANAFNGGNNSESNNTGTNGGGVTQEPKDSQMHVDVNFIPQATLNFDFLKAGNEDKTTNPIQARDGKGGDTEIVD